jgi:hypothetical protein
MTKVLIALCLTAATAAAQEAKVTPLMTQELAGIDGKEGTMIMMEYAPGRVGRSAPAQSSCVCLCAGRGSGDGAGPDIL